MDLRQMYQQCSKEDHDITPLDFVFEHLLNFESIINYFEGEENEEHQPFGSIGSNLQVAITTSTVSFLYPAPGTAFYTKKVYPIHQAAFYSSNYFGDIFHPPIV
ncbi:hypothetical protein GCM10023093_23910 [Nemorincola caseinilytica]|uniref:Uncharacterized protein n=2 Tax=Nemorincola caseinilytica TaxID=2054315 RepID=A0ABP8NIL2_9BACT